MNEACLGGTEAAGVEVYRLEVVFEINVQPFASHRACPICRLPNELSPDTPSLMVGVRLRVEDQRMVTPVPCHIDSAWVLRVLGGLVSRLRLGGLSSVGWFLSRGAVEGV